ncbi:MAG: hypothetical protein ACJ8CR_16775 [Roseiflexaceae bacterium]
MRPLTMPLADPAKTSPRRHICAWCHRDLGALPHNSEFDSYGICADCVRRHFTYLYTPDSELLEAEAELSAQIGGEPVLATRAVGGASRAVREVAL